MEESAATPEARPPGVTVREGTLKLGPRRCAEDVPVPGAGYDDPSGDLADAHTESYGPDPAPTAVHLGWTGDPASTMTLLWWTDADTLASRVELRPGAFASQSIDGVSFLLANEPANGRVHEVRVCGLEPGTRYEYRVGGDEAWSDTYAFTTGPPPGEPLRFVVAGDSRGSPETLTQVLAEAVARGAELLLYTGDAVASGTNVEEWRAWYEAGAGVFETMPIVSVHGNHEALAQPYFALAALPGNEQWFGLDYGDAHFAVVNDTPVDDDTLAAQAAWLAEDLAATNRRWRFHAHHKPAWSSSTVHPEDLDVRETFGTILEAGGVAIDFAGHNHHYERTHPLVGGLHAPDGVTYVVTAGAGAPLYDNDGRNPYTAAFAVTDNYTMVHVDGDVATIIAYDLAGNVLDTWTIQR